MVAVAVLACGNSDRRQADSGGNVATTLSAQQPQQGGPPGALSKPIGQLSGDELFAMTRRLRFTGGNDHPRRCRGRDECRPRGAAAATQATNVRLEAVDTQDSLSVRSVPGNGVVVLRANNRGLIADSMYNMRPSARFEYYLVVFPGVNGGRATWRLEELDVVQGIRSHRTVSTGNVTECNHPFVRGARADFKSCATAAPARPASFRMAVQAPSPGDEAPLWFGCALGCCTADPPDGRS